MKTILNFLTDILAMLIGFIEILIIWSPKIHKKLKELEEYLQEAGTKRSDIKDKLKK